MIAYLLLEAACGDNVAPAAAPDARAPVVDAQPIDAAADAAPDAWHAPENPCCAYYQDLEMFKACIGPIPPTVCLDFVCEAPDGGVVVVGVCGS